MSSCETGDRPRGRGGHEWGSPPFSPARVGTVATAGCTVESVARSKTTVWGLMTPGMHPPVGASAPAADVMAISSL